MATFELEESDFAGFIADGEILPAEVLAVRVVEKPYTEEGTGQKVKKVEFKFRVDDNNSEFDGQNLWGETPTRFNTHPDCKLRNWSTAILGTDLAAGYLLDTDVLVGHRCRIQVELYEYDDKKSAPNDDGTLKKKQRNRVTDVIPSSESMAQMAYAGTAGAEEPF